jgi:heptosyltransferase-3
MSKRILLLSTEHVGDGVLVVAVAQDIRRSLPDSIVDFLAAPGSASVVELDHSINRVIPWRSRDSADALLEDIRKSEYDAAIIFSRKESIFPEALKKIGIPIRVGTGRRLFGRHFTHRVFRSHGSPRMHECAHSRLYGRRLLQALKADVSVCDQPASWDMRIPADAATYVEKLCNQHALTDRRVVIIHAGSLGSSIDLPLVMMAQLADRLHGAGYPCLMSIGPGENHVRQELESACTQEHVYLGDGETGILSLPELMALLQRSALLCANSTGPIHMAAALARPCLGFYPPVEKFTAACWGPVTPHRRIITPKTDTGKNYKRTKYAPADIMQRIDMDDVFAQALSLLDETKDEMENV